MIAILPWLVGPLDAAGRGQCLGWRSELIIPEVTSDLIIGASFLGVLGGMIWFWRRRPDLVAENRALAALLASFLVALALLRLLDALSVWQPIYHLQLVVKIATALLFSATIAAGWPLLPVLARAPSARQLRDANQRLRQEVGAHEATLRELEIARRELEGRVAERTQELGLVTARFRTALRGSRIYVFSQDLELRYTAVSEPMYGLDVEHIVGRTDDEILPPETRATLIALKRSALESGEPKDAEINLPNGGAGRWLDFHIEPLRGPDGIIGLTCAAVDITERKEGEAHLRLLMRELTHRSKNLLAVIQAMARQTARHAGSTEAFLDQFSARLQALATSHDLLIQESWYGVSLSELVRSQLGYYLDRSEQQISIEGASVILKPEVAQNLGLALHELATNALKYGALSVPGGRVAIRWHRIEEPNDNGVEITWAESGGPNVAPPQRRGFGSLVIERNLARSLDAEVELTFPPCGAQCRIVIPSSQLSMAR